MTRPLFHLGERTFYPAGASAVRVRFTDDADGVVMTVNEGDLALSARRRQQPWPFDFQRLEKIIAANQPLLDGFTSRHIVTYSSADDAAIRRIHGRPSNLRGLQESYVQPRCRGEGAASPRAPFLSALGS